jgi:uncharacterized protein with GYD domain
MARYVTLIRFTDQGARNIRKSPTRALAFKKAAEKAGVKVDLQLWTVGKEDGVLILSGDDRKILRTLTQLAALGNVRTRTMQAFDAREFTAIAG